MFNESNQQRKFFGILYSQKKKKGLLIYRKLDKISYPDSGPLARTNWVYLRFDFQIFI